MTGWGQEEDRRRSQEAGAIVFLDIGMPVMNGYQVAQQLRQRPGLERVLLVAMTGWG
jgi:CheY-like chemotaxis protein